MQWQAWFVIALILSSFLLMALTRAAPHWVLLGAMTLLSVTGVLSGEQALAGFSNAGLITVGCMFVVARAMHTSGAIARISSRLLGAPKSTQSALARLFTPVALVSSLLNNTPVVATLIPAVTNWARQIGIAPSKLMIPLSYSAILGGSLTLIGTSTNLVINGEYQSLTGEAGLHMFTITPIALPVALIGGLTMILLFPRLLPDRGQSRLQDDVRQFVIEVAVTRNGPLVGKTIAQAGLRDLRELYLVEIERGPSIVTAVPSEERLQAGDRLIFAGNTEAVGLLLNIPGIEPSTLLEEEPGATPRAGNHPERKLVEAVVARNCAACGRTIRDARFRDRYGAAVLAVSRDGERLRGGLGRIRIRPGDLLLLEARPSFITRQSMQGDFVLLSEREETLPRSRQAFTAWLILGAVVGAAATGLLSMLNAALLGAGAMILTRCCTGPQALQSLDLPVLLTIGASLSLGTALEVSGAADLISDGLLHAAGLSPLLLLILIYALVSTLTEMITNNAAGILVLPVVLALTSTGGWPAEPFILALMMAASASFATPVGYQTNLMVYGPGRYRFSDFLRVGLPFNIWIGTLTIGSLAWWYPLGS